MSRGFMCRPCVQAVAGLLLLLLLLLVPSSTSAAEVSSRILGGKNAKLGQLPFMVHVHSDQSVCAGSLISDRFVLSAAHCFKPLSGEGAGQILPAADFEVYLGTTAIANGASKRRTHGVKAISVHPTYTASNDRINRYDVAVLELSEPTNFDKRTGPITLLKDASVYDQLVAQYPHPVRVAGWGLLQSNATRTSANLKFVDLPVVSKANCDFALGGSVGDQHVCAGGEDGKDSCQGDSGGPLVMVSTVNGTQKAYVQIGVTVSGTGTGLDPKCGGVYEYGTYLKLADNTTLDFIYSVIGGEDKLGTGVFSAAQASLPSVLASALVLLVVSLCLPSM